jgi:hypothetical protein
MLDHEAVLLIVAQFIRETQQRVHGKVAASQLGEAFTDVALTARAAEIRPRFQGETLSA